MTLMTLTDLMFNCSHCLYKDTLSAACTHDFVSRSEVEWMLEQGGDFDRKCIEDVKNLFNLVFAIKKRLEINANKIYH